MLSEASDANPTWLLMMGHYPIYSAGEHGDMAELVQNLMPSIKKHNVQMYFCGHDHISEHLSLNGTEFIVNGAGSMTDVLGSASSSAKLVWSGTGIAYHNALHGVTLQCIFFFNVTLHVCYLSSPIACCIALFRFVLLCITFSRFFSF
jgi:hypothetical protein